MWKAVRTERRYAHCKSHTAVQSQLWQKGTMCKYRPCRAVPAWMVPQRHELAKGAA